MESAAIYSTMLLSAYRQMAEIVGRSSFGAKINKTPVASRHYQNSKQRPPTVLLDRGKKLLSTKKAPTPTYSG